MLPAHLTLRLAHRADAAAIAAMSRDLIETGLGWTWRRARVERNIASPSTLSVVAADRDRVAAFAIMYFGDAHAHLNLLAVQRDCQGAGVGRHMMTWLEESALTAGIEVVRLELRETNTGARRFYERLGFAVVGRVPNYYAGVEAAVRMTREIRRVRAAPVTDWRSLLR